jgi:hypothetical protein
METLRGWGCQISYNGIIRLLELMIFLFEYLIHDLLMDRRIFLHLELVDVAIVPSAFIGLFEA